MIVTDKDGDSDTASVDLTVHNVAPTITTVQAPPDIDEGSAAAITVSFTDPGVLDTHVATIDWGDGSVPEAGVVDQSRGSGTLRGIHQYFVPGDYTIRVTVVDNDGGEGSDSLIRTVVRLPIAINIKPGSDPNSINLRDRVPVAILTTLAGEYDTPEDFDATEVDVSTVRFGPRDVLEAGGGGTEVHGRGHIEDSTELDESTKDGDLDMVLHVDASSSGIGETTPGRNIRPVATAS